MQRPLTGAWTAAALCALLYGPSCASGQRLPPRLPFASADVQRAGLYPETIVYDSTSHSFLLSSLRDGGVYALDDTGRVSPKVADPRLCSVLGIALDERRGRLWVVNADLGISVRPSAAGKGQLAAVGLYDAESGAPRAYVDLAQLLPAPHLLNGIAVDEGTGDVFVTDSFAPAIYRVGADGGATIFLQDPRLAGNGVNLNGVVVHPDGYLLVVKKSDGFLFKVPLRNPELFTTVKLERAFLGGDGLMLLGKDQLVVVANKIPGAATNAAFLLASPDGWQSATVTRTEGLGEIYPTTSVLRDGQVFVLSSHLDELIKATPAELPTLRREGRVASLATFSTFPQTQTATCKENPCR